MNQELHTRAEQLIAQERVEGISSADQHWLRQHLAECPSCSARATATEQALRSLRSLSVPFPKTLASRTQFRVRLRAQQFARRTPLAHGLAACGISWAFGAATAPYSGAAWNGPATAWVCPTLSGNLALDFGGRCPAGGGRRHPDDRQRRAHQRVRLEAPNELS